jgi:hypothetical protein
MKPHLNLIWGIAGLAAVANAPMLMAADAQAPYGIITSSSPALPDYSRSTSILGSTSNAVIVALNAQALLLKDMLQEHQDRAAKLKQKNESENLKWETELLNELKEKSERVQKSIDQMSQSGAKDLKSTGGGVDDELVFLSTVEGRLEQLRQELSAAIEESRILSMQVATNKTPEDIGAMSFVLGDNQRVVKDLQKEQLDLELRKLEFRALRKAMQK